MFEELNLTILEKEKTWCHENAINFTPEILINGQSFPKEYHKQDIMYFIEDMHEKCCLKNIESNKQLAK